MTTDKNKDVMDFFSSEMEAMNTTGIVIPDSGSIFDVLGDLKAARFKDGAGESLGEEMPMFILDYKQRYGIAPWEKPDDSGAPPKEQFYGEVWMVPTGGKLGESRMVCRMIKKISQFRLLAASVARCMAEKKHFRQVVWVPKFEPATGPMGSYYKMKFTPRDPESDHEWELLKSIVELLRSDPELSQLRDDTTNLLYMQDLSQEEKKNLLMAQRVIKPQLPAAPTASTPALPATNGTTPAPASYSDQF
ncbi:MAG: hypothetical protein AAF810_01380 [Cyanobacteria bacterium P01_D01_bin.36]